MPIRDIDKAVDMLDERGSGPVWFYAADGTMLFVSGKLVDIQDENNDPEGIGFIVTRSRRSGALVEVDYDVFDGQEERPVGTPV